jgi:hypothetical protein
VFSYSCTLKQSCEKIVTEQKLFNDHLMKITRTISKVAHKLGIGADWHLQNLAKSLCCFSAKCLSWSFISCKSLSFKQKCSTLVALPEGEIYQSNHQMVLELQSEEVWVFSRNFTVVFGWSSVSEFESKPCHGRQASGRARRVSS